MKQVGSRHERGVALAASGSLLAEGARFNEAVSRLSQSTFVPKGIYRYRSHEAANQHADDCLVRGMALLAGLRQYAETIDLDGIPVKTVNLEGLLLTKRTMRDKDVADRIIIERALALFRSQSEKKT